MIVPTKEDIFSDKLPDKFANENLDNDYHRYKKLLEEHQIEYWDLINYYQKIIDTASHPVYSPTSVHWTKYGASFTTFKLLNDMNEHFGNRMNTLYVKDKKTSQFVHSDGDTESALNLISRIDTSSNFLYYTYDVNYTKDAFKPRVLTLGDSFYGTIRDCRNLDKIYSEESKYLYYYSTAHYTHGQPSKSVKDLDMAEEFKKADAFILLNSSNNLKDFPFGFQNDIDKIIDALNTLPDVANS